MTTSGTLNTRQPDTEDPVDRLMERCRDLHEDLELTAVQAWKSKEAGRVAVGYVPIYVPEEILDAVGALPVGLIGGGDRTDIIPRRRLLPVLHLPYAPQHGGAGTAQQAGRAGRRALPRHLRRHPQPVRYLAAPVPGKYVRFVDLPQNFDRDVGGWFYTRELQTLARDVGALTGIPLDDERLRESIRNYNRNRSLVADLHRLRRERPQDVPTYEAYLVQRAGHLLPVGEHNALLEEYLEAARGRDRPVQDNARIALIGSPSASSRPSPSSGAWNWPAATSWTTTTCWETASWARWRWTAIPWPT